MKSTVLLVVLVLLPDLGSSRPHWTIDTLWVTFLFAQFVPGSAGLSLGLLRVDSPESFGGGTFPFAVMAEIQDGCPEVPPNLIPSVIPWGLKQHGAGRHPRVRAQRAAHHGKWSQPSVGGTSGTPPHKSGLTGLLRVALSPSVPK